MSQFGSFGEESEGLTNAQIRHDFFAAAINAGEFKAFLEFFDKRSHSTAGNRSSSENLAGVVRNKAGRSSGLELQKRNLPA